MNARTLSEDQADKEETIAARILNFAYGSDEHRAISLIEQEIVSNPGFDLLQVKDSRGYTLLHISALNSLSKLATLVLSKIELSKSVPVAKIEEYIKSQTDEGFTALHFSAFRGNVKLIRSLQKHGADIRTRNQQELNALHIAAQGDQPAAMAYCLENGLHIGDKDNKGSTPLHWAAFLGCENSTNFLTVWGANPNLTDEEGGLTPLHLAVISGNTRVVRKLLIKGADRHIRSKDGKLPMDIAKENDYDNIIYLLKGRNFFTECFNIRPGLGNKRTRGSLLLFFAIYVLPSVVDFLFVLPFAHLSSIVIFFVLFGVAMTLFCCAWLTNPGYLKKNNQKKILELLEENASMDICPECEIIKPQRSRHCELCNQCIQVFDHHCPWINNCVGARNHAFFYGFILVMVIDLAFLTIFGAISLASNELTDILNPIFQLDFEAFLILKNIFCIATIGGCLIFIFPLSVLVYVQTKNLLLDKTTSERFGYQRKSKEVTPGNTTQDLLKRVNSDDSYSALQEKQSQRACSIYVSNCLNVCYRNAYRNEYKEKEA